MDSRAAQDGQSGSRGWTAGLRGSGVGPSVELTVTTLESWNLSILGTILPKLGRIFAADRFNMLFFYTPAAPGASQGAPVAWIRENRPLTGGRFLRTPVRYSCTKQRNKDLSLSLRNLHGGVLTPEAHVSEYI